MFTFSHFCFLSVDEGAKVVICSNIGEYQIVKHKLILMGNFKRSWAPPYYEMSFVSMSTVCLSGSAGARSDAVRAK